MKYYSTNKKAPMATLEKAVVKGLAEDKGLYMPENIKPLPKEFFDNIDNMSFQEIAYTVADAFFGEDVDADSLKKIVYDTLAFDCPVVPVSDNIYTLELFHGPTLAFMDADLNAHMKLTSANSINVARFLPQAFYYFYAYAQMKKQGKADQMVMCVPSGNFGNICAALFGHRMGLPIKRFVAANNANDIFYNYLQTGKYNPQPSKATLANAMDVGDPSNFARIYDLYKGDHKAITSLISGATYKDEQIRDTMRQCHKETGYVLDPHGACGYQALKDLLQPGEYGVFCETAHPAKFKEKVDDILSTDIEIPARLLAFMKGTKQSVEMSKDFADFKAYLLKQ